MKLTRPPMRWCHLKVRFQLLEFYAERNELTDSDITERMLTASTASTSTHKPDVVIFSGTGPTTSEPLSKKLQGKAFMVRSFLLSLCFHLTSPQVF
jgi:hypothetical protein